MARAWIGRVALLAAGLVALAPGAHAQFRTEFNPYCDRLQAQYLAALQQANSGPSGASMVQLDQLSRQLAAMQLASRQNNCGGGFFFTGPAPSRACPAINAEMARISRQIAQLRGSSNYGFFGFYTPQQEADRLRGILAEGGCDVPLWGGTRTLCVRLCDGYYFPIDAQANSSRFQINAQTCQSMYAQAGQAELFVQPPGADVADATSLVSGRRYGDIENALLYRESYVPACAVQLRTGIAALVQRYLALLPKKKGAIVAALRRSPLPLPQARPPASEDPETLANAAGAFRLGPVMPKSPNVADAAPHAVRMVGDAYYAELFDLARVRAQQQLRPSLGLIGPAAAAEATPLPAKAAGQ